MTLSNAPDVPWLRGAAPRHEGAGEEAEDHPSDGDVWLSEDEVDVADGNREMPRKLDAKMAAKKAARLERERAAAPPPWQDHWLQARPHLTLPCHRYIMVISS